jgi:hypothetical protein
MGELEHAKLETKLFPIWFVQTFILTTLGADWPLHNYRGLRSMHGPFGRFGRHSSHCYSAPIIHLATMVARRG